MKDDTHIFAPPQSPLTFTHLVNVFITDDDFTGSWMVDPRDHVQQGGFPAARFAHDGDKLAVVQLHINGFKGYKFTRRVDIHLVDIAQYDPDSPQVKLVMDGKTIYGHYTQVRSPMDDIQHEMELKALAIIPVTHEGRIVAALHLASQAGGVDLVGRLLAEGADPNARDATGTAPLHLALGAGREAVVKLLLDKGADFEVSDPEGWLPLHRAASKGLAGAVRVLLEGGADPDVPGIEGKRPLHFAAEADATEIAAAIGLSPSGTRTRLERVLTRLRQELA